jgi:hypothetical protein
VCALERIDGAGSTIFRRKEGETSENGGGKEGEKK